MMTSSSSIRTQANVGPSTLARFALVGAAGFVVDATILTLLVEFAGWAPWMARGVSFITAVTTTWLLNRRYTYSGRKLHHTALEAFWYGLIQVGGALINLAIFAILLRYFSTRLLVIPLAIGAVGGLAFNFTLTSWWLYAKR